MQYSYIYIFSDLGTVPFFDRFGESNMTRIVKWILKSNEKITKSSTFLDIGCGNGMLLVKLVGLLSNKVRFTLLACLFSGKKLVVNNSL